MVSGTRRRLHRRRQNIAHWSAFGLRPWWTCAADTFVARERACSSTTESTPPDSPTRTRLPWSPSSVRPTAAVTSALLGFLELAIAHEPFEPRFHQLLRLLVLDLLQRLGQRALERLRRHLRIAVRAAERLGNDPVDEAEGLQPAGGDAERLGRIRCHLGAAPQDGGTAFRRDHGIDGVLHHLHYVTNGDGERSARAALADDGGDERGLEPRHLEEVASDRLRLAALLGIDSGIGAGR